MVRRIAARLQSLGAMLHAMSRAQAEWELAASREILGRRKVLLVVAVAPVLVLLAWSGAQAQSPPPGPAAVVADAAATPPEKLPVLGGSKAYLPALITPGMFYGSILVGLIAGLITGVIGAGGGYILTPALMSFGVRGIMSVGTDQFHLFAKAIMGTAIHGKLGNVNLRLAVWFVLGSAGGVTLGGRLSRALFQHSPALSDAVISAVYVVVLGLLGVYAVGDWWRQRPGRRAAPTLDATTALARWLQAVPLQPRVTFDEAILEGGRSISVYPVVVCGFIVGFVAAVMGVGGGFLTFPMFVYGLGVSTFTTVGTDILQIIFTTAYSSIAQYAIYGFVFYTVAIGMLIGSLVGVQIGAMVTQVVKGAQIRAFYALTILAGFFNRLCALPRKLADLGYVALPREAAVLLEQLGVVLFFTTVGLFALWILWLFGRHVGLLRRDRRGQPIPAGGPLVVDPGKFGLGLAGLAVFAALLVAGVLPGRSGAPLLSRADQFFNQLAKGSIAYLPEAKAQAAAHGRLAVDFGVRPREMVDAAALQAVVRSSGCEATITADGRTRIVGTMGQLAQAALDDAERMVANDVTAIEQRHGRPAEDVIYCWWAVFDGLTRRYVQDNQSREANFTKFVATKVLEPAYNFRGIEARGIRGEAGPLAGLLGFYLLYTVWYGFAILLVFEGLGITATVVSGRQEQ